MKERVLGPIARVRLFAALRSSVRFGFSRSGVLAASGKLYPHAARTPMRRLLSLIFGSSMIGVGVALLVQADLGMSPYDVMVSGLQPRLGISFGQTVWVCSAFFYTTAFLLGERPSRWGVAYTFANGVAIDAARGLINSPDSMAGRLVFVFASLLILSSGISLVVHSGSTGGAFELLMRAGAKRGLPRGRTRTALEVGVLTFGLLMGGRFGIATVIIAIGIGPMLNVMGQALSDYSKGREARVTQPHGADVPEQELADISV